MSGKYLLDTNIVIALFADETSVKDHLAETGEIYVPSIVIGELYYGAHKSSRAKDNLARIDDFAASNVVLGCDAETARHYGEVKNSLRLKGRPVPENDIWIAAIAVQHDFTVVSRDTHFSEVESLKVEVW